MKTMKTSLIQGTLALLLVWSGVGCGQGDDDRPRSRGSRPVPESPRRGSRIASDSERSLMISEFMAVNDSFLRDDQGEFSDWIEIRNYGDAPIDLAGWSLTDDPVEVDKWSFPARTIESGESLVFFASGRGKEPGLESHCTFRLAAGGEFLGLVSPEGEFVHQFSARYPIQRRDLSYGIASNWRVGLRPADFEGYFEQPTPGESNAALLIGQVEPIVFSHSGGVIGNRLELELDTKTAGAVIYYSIDGRYPNELEGQRYEESILITEDTVVRARAVKPGYQSSPIAVRSFLLVQETQGAGRALRSTDSGLPIISLAIEPGEASGRVGTREVISRLRNEQGGSLEWIDPKSGGWQVGCGIRARKRKEDSEKAQPALRLYFRDQHGPARLKRNLFGTGSASRFDRLELLPVGGTESGLGAWDRLCQNLMGAGRQPFARGRFCHVFLNGGYLGVYDLRERIDLEFAESYFWGTESQLDMVESESKSTLGGEWYRVVEGDEGDWVHWAATVESLPGSPSSVRTDEWTEVVDFENFVFFSVLSWFRDGVPLANSLKWIAIRTRAEPAGYRFLFETNPGESGGPVSQQVTREGQGELRSYWNYLVREKPARVRDQVTAMFTPGGVFAVEELRLRAEQVFSQLERGRRADASFDAEAKQAFLDHVRERRKQLLSGLTEMGLVGSPTDLR